MGGKRMGEMWVDGEGGKDGWEENGGKVGGKCMRGKL